MLRSFSLFGFVFVALAAVALKAAPKRLTLAPRRKNDDAKQDLLRRPVLFLERACPFHARFSLN